MKQFLIVLAVTLALATCCTATRGEEKFQRFSRGIKNLYHRRSGSQGGDGATAVASSSAVGGGPYGVGASASASVLVASGGLGGGSGVGVSGGSGGVRRDHERRRFFKRREPNHRHAQYVQQPFVNRGHGHKGQYGTYQQPMSVAGSSTGAFVGGSVAVASSSVAVGANGVSTAAAGAAAGAGSGVGTGEAAGANAGAGMSGKRLALHENHGAHNHFGQNAHLYDDHHHNLQHHGDHQNFGHTSHHYDDHHRTLQHHGGHPAPRFGARRFAHAPHQSNGHELEVEHDSEHFHQAPVVREFSASSGTLDNNGNGWEKSSIVRNTEDIQKHEDGREDSDHYLKESSYGKAWDEKNRENYKFKDEDEIYTPNYYHKRKTSTKYFNDSNKAGSESGSNILEKDKHSSSFNKDFRKLRENVDRRREQQIGGKMFVENSPSELAYDIDDEERYDSRNLGNFHGVDGMHFPKQSGRAAAGVSVH